MELIEIKFLATSAISYRRNKLIELICEGTVLCFLIDPQANNIYTSYFQLKEKHN
jgi:hypothetical protein